MLQHMVMRSWFALYCKPAFCRRGEVQQWQEGCELCNTLWSMQEQGS
jgi:hypothetical protein